MSQRCLVDNTAPMRATKPLIQLDAGWLFIIAGLALCVPGVLIPAQQDLFMLQQQRDQLRAQELHNNAILRTHVEFLRALDENDPTLTRRLVASQLNMIPHDDTPLLLVSHPSNAIHQWIESASAVPAYEPAQWTDTTLSQLASGPRRLWLLCGGVLCVFVGLISGGPMATRQRADTGTTTVSLHTVADEADEESSELNHHDAD
jgi:hypothetical protein